MIFSKEKTTLAYTVEKCTECEKSRKRDFVQGDVLFTKSSNCSFCGKVTIIEKIFGEVLER